MKPHNNQTLWTIIKTLTTIASSQYKILHEDIRQINRVLQEIYIDEQIKETPPEKPNPPGKCTEIVLNPVVLAVIYRTWKAEKEINLVAFQNDKISYSTYISNLTRITQEFSNKIFDWVVAEGRKAEKS